MGTRKTDPVADAVKARDAALVAADKVLDDATNAVHELRAERQRLLDEQDAKLATAMDHLLVARATRDQERADADAAFLAAVEQARQDAADAAAATP